jgi:hypothetical protein
MFEELTIDNGEIMVTLSHEGEGYNGDYDPEDESDAPLIRFTILERTENENQWEAIASSCTQYPTSITRDELVKIANRILDSAKNAPNKRTYQALSTMDLLQ